MVLYIYSVKQTKNYGSASNFPYGRLSKLWYPKTLDFPIIQYHPIIHFGWFWGPKNHSKSHPQTPACCQSHGGSHTCATMIMNSSKSKSPLPSESALEKIWDDPGNGCWANFGSTVEWDIQIRPTIGTKPTTSWGYACQLPDAIISNYRKCEIKTTQATSLWWYLGNTWGYDQQWVWLKLGEHLKVAMFMGELRFWTMGRSSLLSDKPPAWWSSVDRTGHETNARRFQDNRCKKVI